jgi:hypothetical protein
MPETIHLIPAGADLRIPFIAALRRNGGSMHFSHLEIGEAAFASFASAVVVEQDDDGATLKLVDREATDA